MVVSHCSDFYVAMQLDDGCLHFMTSVIGVGKPFQPECRRIQVLKMDGCRRVSQLECE